MEIYKLDIMNLQETLIKEDGYILFFIKTDEDKSHNMEFEVYKVDKWLDKTPEAPFKLYIKGEIDLWGRVDLTIEDLILEGYMDYLELMDVLYAVWRKAEKEIEMFDPVTADSMIRWLKENKNIDARKLPDYKMSKYMPDFYKWQKEPEIKHINYPWKYKNWIS